MIKNPRIILCLGILLGVLLSIFIHHIDAKPIQNVHENVKHAYRAHKEAKKEYLKRYREAYLESILSSKREKLMDNNDNNDKDDDDEGIIAPAADVERENIITEEEEEEKEAGDSSILKESENNKKVIDDLTVAQHEQKLAEKFTVAIFASHANPQLCITLKSALMNGLDVHVLGFNASALKGSADLKQTAAYRDFYCKLKSDDLTSGGVGFESLFQKGATAEKFAREWLLRDLEKIGGQSDVLELSFAAMSALWPVVSLFYPNKSKTWFGDWYPKEHNTTKTKDSFKYANAGGWIGKAGSLCTSTLFTKMVEIKEATKELAKVLPGRTLHLQGQVHLALAEIGETRPDKVDGTIDFHNRFFYSGMMNGLPYCPKTDNVTQEIEVELKSGEIKKPLWFTYINSCWDVLGTQWFMKLNKADFRNRTGKKEALVKIHYYEYRKEGIDADTQSNVPEITEHLEDICPYAWNTSHDWRYAEHDWEHGPLEFGELFDMES
jgi:hypothetical protein